MHISRPITRSRLLAVALGACLTLAACGGSDTDASADDSPPDTTGASEVTTADSTSATESTSPTSETTNETTSDTTSAVEEADTTSAAETASPGCATIAALFATKGSANPDLVDPEVAATCDGDTINVVSNGVPDYTYIGTSPGEPDGREFTFSMPAEPTMADSPTAVPYIGPIGMTLNGISIYGPTEGTGGDVDSLPGIISECGSHNGPGGFHTHKILASENTDCFFTPEEVAAAPQLAGYAFDGFPIYTGVDQYESSWQLTDESLFASDTWAAHTYVEGSGDLDECNGRFDEDGNYAYYTTEAFPYVLGCFAGEVELELAGGEGGGQGAAQGGDRPERPEGGEGEDAARPERPEPREGGERPERPASADEGTDG